MRERPGDDTTEPVEGARRPKRSPLGYYYDDGTGYEVYDPQGDEEEDEEDDAGGVQENDGAQE